MLCHVMFCFVMYVCMYGIHMDNKMMWGHVDGVGVVCPLNFQTHKKCMCMHIYTWFAILLKFSSY